MLLNLGKDKNVLLGGGVQELSLYLSSFDQNFILLCLSKLFHRIYWAHVNNNQGEAFFLSFLAEEILGLQIKMEISLELFCLDIWLTH